MKYLSTLILLIFFNFLAIYPNNTFRINSELFRFDNQSLTILNKNNHDAIAKFEIYKDRLLNVIEQTHEQIILQNFPVSSSRLADIYLTKAPSIVDEFTVFTRLTDNGLINIDGFEIISYFGKIINDENSKIYLTLIDNDLSAVIMHGSGDIFEILKFPDNKDTKNISWHTIEPKDWSEILGKINQFCGTDDISGIYHEIPQKYLEDEIQATELITIPIAIEGEYYFYEQMGKDYQRAVKYMLSVMSQTSRIYEEFVNVTFYISYIQINESDASCPYVSFPNLAQKLYRMPQAWSNKSGINRGLAVLFANIFKQPPGTIVAGISMGGQPYRGSLCNLSTSYCVLGIRGNYNYPTASYTWDINVAAHEIGHNFGCPHTHACFWRPNMIDTCITSTIPYESDGCVTTGQPIPRPGTIMSYCHLTNATRSVELVFHQRELPLLRIAADRAACIKPPAQPIVKLLNPLGGNRLFGGETENIRWTHSKVNKVNLRYSTDNGKNWFPIANEIPAKDSIYKWTIPFVNSENVRVLIFDSSNPLVADTSIVSFSISSPFLNLLSPQAEEKYGHREIITVTWQKNLIETVSIEFSSDGGTKWDLLSSNISSSAYEWEVPEIVSDNCMIRVIDEKNQTLVSTSGKFAIGSIKFKLLSPTPGDVWCIGETYQIKWESEFLNKIIMEYSIDLGITWRRVRITALDANSGSYEWKIPARASDSTLLRVILPNQNEYIVYQMNDYFSLDSCLSGVYGYPKTVNDFAITNIIPNPFQKSATIVLNSNIIDTFFADFYLFDSNGKLIDKILQSVPINVGSNSISVDLPDLSQGIYFLIIQSPQNLKSTSLKIIK